MPIAHDVDLEELAERTQRYTGADLENLVRRAGMQALREDLDADLIPMRYFEEALAQSRASVTPEMEQEYQRLSEELKQEGPSKPRIGFQ